MKEVITKLNLNNKFKRFPRFKINTILLLVLLILVIGLYILVRHTPGICEAL